MRVLISLLGLAPGVATGAYYAFYHGWGIEQPVQIDKVVTLGTSAQGMDRFEDEIAREFDRWRWETGIQVQYDDSCRLHIAADDLRDEASVREFREIITYLLCKDYKDDEVYLVVAGGRKSMAALAAVATQLYGHGVQGMYHLYVDKDLEDDGAPERFWVIGQEQQREVMRPPQGQCALVEIPYLQVREVNGQFQLALKGSLEEITFEYLRQHSLFVEALDQRSAEKFWGYIFEEKVASYLECGSIKHKYPQAVPHFRIPGHESAGDVDVYAFWDHPREKRRKVLVCECKLRLAATPDFGRLEEAIDQIVRLKRPAIEAYEGERQKQDQRKRSFEWWVVTNMTPIPREVVARAQQNGIQIQVATLPLNWRARLDWEIPNIKQATINGFSPNDSMGESGS